MSRDPEEDRTPTDPEEDRTPTDPEDFNDLQAWLEGDARQQDAAALRLDRRAVAAGQMSPDAFRRAWPGEDVPRSPWTLPSPVSYGPLPLCLHPRATTELRPAPPWRWRKSRCRGRWALRRAAGGRGTYVRRCPDCPAAVYAAEAADGMRPVLELAPWLLSTTHGTPDDRNGV